MTRHQAIHEQAMTRDERRSTAALAGVVSMRLFGLFLVLPVLAELARDLPGATPVRIGLALGIYGLTQGLLQVPFGWLSDRVGRRPVIAAGLVLFIAGSVLAALSSHMFGIIAGRALQGCGAVAGAAMALAADNTRAHQRSKTMALIGSTVGASFLLAMLGGPVFAGWVGLSGLFWITALLGILALVLLFAVVPRPAARAVGPMARFRRPSPEEAMLCLGAFLLHAILTALFVALPGELIAGTGLPVTDHWQLYLPAMAVAGGLTLAWIFRSRERQAVARLLPSALAMATACLAFAVGVSDWYWVLAWIALFFAGFNLLEATLPALMSLVVPEARRGAAMGLYATCQFLGAFAGGTAGGWVLGAWGYQGVFVLAAAAGGCWAALLAATRGPLAGAVRRGLS